MVKVAIRAELGVYAVVAIYLHNPVTLTTDHVGAIRDHMLQMSLTGHHRRDEIRFGIVLDHATDQGEPVIRPLVSDCPQTHLDHDTLDYSSSVVRTSEQGSGAEAALTKLFDVIPLRAPVVELLSPAPSAKVSTSTRIRPSLESVITA